MAYKSQKTTSAPRGTKIVEPGYAPMHGEPMINKNPAAKGGRGGGPRDLSDTISGGSVPTAAGARSGRSGAKR